MVKIEDLTTSEKRHIAWEVMRSEFEMVVEELKQHALGHGLKLDNHCLDAEDKRLWNDSNTTRAKLLIDSVNAWNFVCDYFDPEDC